MPTIGSPPTNNPFNRVQMGAPAGAIEKDKNEYKELINKLQVLENYNDEGQVNSIVEEYLRR
jgi:hypothetical protein